MILLTQESPSAFASQKNKVFCPVQINPGSIKTHQYPWKSPKTKGLIFPANPCFVSGMDPRPLLDVVLLQSGLLSGAQIQVTVMSGRTQPALWPPSPPNTSCCTLTGGRILHDIPKGPGLILHPNTYTIYFLQKIKQWPHHTWEAFKTIIPLIITRVDWITRGAKHHIKN